MTRLITSIRVDHGPGHDHCHVFVQGALTGMLVVDTGKGHALAAEMLGVTVEAFRAVARVHDGRSFQVFASELPAVTLGQSGEALERIDDYIGNEGPAAADPSHPIWNAVDTAKQLRVAVERAQVRP